VSSSVALGAALRAAAHELGQGLDELAGAFCQPAEGVMDPDPATIPAYQALEDEYRAALQK